MNPSSNEIQIANGAISRVGTILDGLGAHSILLVTHTEAYENSGADAKLKEALSTRRVLPFTSFEPNPKLHDA